MPFAVPPDSTIASPPASTVVETALPVDCTSSVAPVDTVALVRVAPPLTTSVPPSICQSWPEPVAFQVPPITSSVLKPEYCWPAPTLEKSKP